MRSLIGIFIVERKLAQFDAIPRFDDGSLKKNDGLQFYPGMRIRIRTFWHAICIYRDKISSEYHLCT